MSWHFSEASDLDEGLSVGRPGCYMLLHKCWVIFFFKLKCVKTWWTNNSLKKSNLNELKCSWNCWWMNRFFQLVNKLIENNSPSSVAKWVPTEAAKRTWTLRFCLRAAERCASACHGDSSFLVGGYGYMCFGHGGNMWKLTLSKGNESHQYNMNQCNCLQT